MKRCGVQALLTIVMAGAALLAGVVLEGLVLDHGPGAGLGPVLVGVGLAAVVVVLLLSRTRHPGEASSGPAAGASLPPEGVPR